MGHLWMYDIGAWANLPAGPRPVRTSEDFLLVQEPGAQRDIQYEARPLATAPLPRR